LEMSVDTEIEITENEYSHYVLDKWHWSNAVSTSSSSYASSSSTSTTTRSYLKRLSQYDD